MPEVGWQSISSNDLSLAQSPVVTCRHARRWSWCKDVPGEPYMPPWIYNQQPQNRSTSGSFGAKRRQWLALKSSRLSRKSLSLESPVNRVLLQPPDLARWSDRSGAIGGNWSIGHQIWALAPNPSQAKFAKTVREFGGKCGGTKGELRGTHCTRDRSLTLFPPGTECTATISKTRFRAIEGVSSHRRALEPIEPIAAIDLHSTGQNKGLL
jgi:hypothetical protein